MNKIKKKIFIMLGNHLLRNITNKLGIVEVTDDKIICYVDNKKLKKYRKGKYLTFYELILKTKNGCPKETLDIYKVNKPVYFVINNMNFETALTIMTGKDTNITFSNCKFNREVSIYSGGEIVLENNQYCDEDRVYKNSLVFCRIDCKSLKFVNDNFVNKSTYKTQTNFGIMIDTDNLEIINSNFDLKNNDGVISVRTKNMNIDNSDIICHNSIYIKSDEINSIDTTIKSETEVVIENKNNNYIMGVTSPKTIYNGMDLSKYHSLEPKNMELQKSRIALVESLRILRDKCINISLSKTIEATGVVKTKRK